MHILFDALEWIIDPLYHKISMAKYFKKEPEIKKLFEYR